MRHFRAMQLAPRRYVYGPDDTRDCKYCGKPVLAHDWSEGGPAQWSVSFHHTDCWHSLKEGGRYVILWSAVGRPTDEERGYDNLQRAIDSANDSLGWNPGTVFVVYDTVERVPMHVTAMFNYESWKASAKKREQRHLLIK